MSSQALGVLTPAQVRVLRLVAVGLSDTRIAAELGLSVHTVRRHVEHAMRRLGTHSRVESIARLYAAGVLLPFTWPPELASGVKKGGAAPLPRRSVVAR